MSKVTTITYACTNMNCKHVEERQESTPQARHCPICGHLMRYAGKREVER